MKIRYVKGGDNPLCRYPNYSEEVPVEEKRSCEVKIDSLYSTMDDGSRICCICELHVRASGIGQYATFFKDGKKPKLLVCYEKGGYRKIDAYDVFRISPIMSYGPRLLEAKGYKAKKLHLPSVLMKLWQSMRKPDAYGYDLVLDSFNCDKEDLGDLIFFLRQRLRRMGCSVASEVVYEWGCGVEEK